MEEKAKVENKSKHIDDNTVPVMIGHLGGIVTLNIDRDHLKMMCPTGKTDRERALIYALKMSGMG